MTQIDELLRQTATAVERDAEAERRTIGRAQRALSAAIAAEASQDRPRANGHRRWGTRLPRRATGLGLAVAGAAAAAIAVVALVGSTGSGGPAVADAAIMHIRAELTAPAGSILHEAATVTPTGGSPMQFELWAQTGGTGVYRVIKYGTEASQSATQNETYDPSTRTVTVSPLPPAVHAYEVAHSVDPASKLKEMVNSGQATATATTFDGIPAYEIQVNVSGVPALEGATAYVAQSDYRPLAIDSSQGKVVFSAYEYLPATPATDALLAVTTAHPGATVINQTGNG